MTAARMRSGTLFLMRVLFLCVGYTCHRLPAVTLYRRFAAVALEPDAAAFCRSNRI
jgi:hypothetical protein